MVSSWKSEKIPGAKTEAWLSNDKKFFCWKFCSLLLIYLSFCVWECIVRAWRGAMLYVRTTLRWNEHRNCNIKQIYRVGNVLNIKNIKKHISLFVQNLTYNVTCVVNMNILRSLLTVVEKLIPKLQVVTSITQRITDVNYSPRLFTELTPGPRL
jgi:hypothetical protein